MLFLFLINLFPGNLETNIYRQEHVKTHGISSIYFIHISNQKSFFQNKLLLCMVSHKIAAVDSRDHKELLLSSFVNLIIFVICS